MTHWPLTSAGYIAAGEPEVQLQRVIRGGCHRTRQRVDVAAPALRPTHCAIGMRDASKWSVLRHGPHSVHYAFSAGRIRHARSVYYCCSVLVSECAIYSLVHLGTTQPTTTGIGAAAGAALRDEFIQ